MGRYFANPSSAGASAGCNITPGTYYVTGNGATGYIDINVCSYTPSTDGTSNCDDYDVGYYGGASMIVVDPNDRVEISSSNSGSKTNWQLRKKQAVLLIRLATPLHERLETISPIFPPSRATA